MLVLALAVALFPVFAFAWFKVTYHAEAFDSIRPAEWIQLDLFIVLVGSALFGLAAASLILVIGAWIEKIRDRNKA